MRPGTIGILLCMVGFLLGTTSSLPNQRNLMYCVSEEGSCDQSLHCVECQPLMWFVNRTHTIPNDSIILFLPGNHSLNSKGQSNVIMNFSNKDNLTLRGSAGTNNSSEFPSVVCSGSAGFRFKFSSNIHIQGLIFQHCGIPVLSSSSSALHFLDTTNISLSHIAIIDSIGFSLAIVQVCRGYVNITNSLFKRCTLSTCKYSGNLLIAFDYCPSHRIAPASLALIDSLVSFGSRDTRGRGLVLRIHQPMVSAELYNVTLTNGTVRGKSISAEFGGNVAINMLIFEKNSSKVHFVNSQIVNGSAQHGGGIYTYLIRHSLNCSSTQSSQLFNTTTEIAFTNTTFYGNNASIANSSGGGLFLTHEGQIGLCHSQSKLTLNSCTFTHNYAKTGVGMLISQRMLPRYSTHVEPQLLLTLDNCTFSENYLVRYHEQASEDGIVDLYTVSMTIIRNSIFVNNEGTALLMLDSAVKFEEETRFVNNSAVYGAAIQVCDTSLMYLENGSHVLFENNTAQIAGGAIYAGDQCLAKLPRCFYQPIGNVTKEDLRGSLTFINNSAAVAGGAIYGGSVDHCYTINTVTSRFSSNLDGALYKAIFSITPNISTMVTSDPYGVCVCDPATGEPDCQNRTFKIKEKVFPGEKFKINLTAVGQTDGPIPALLNVSTTNNDSNLTVYRKGNFILIICQTITLALLSKPGKTVTLAISVKETNPAKQHSNYYQIPKLSAQVTMAPCPWVFQLNKTNGCDCNMLLYHISKTMACDISSGSIQMPRGTWLHCVDGNSETPCKKLEVSSSCRHCRDEQLTLTPKNISDQCVPGRDGRLCGSCKSNFSLSLGFQNCVDTEENCSIWKLIVLLFAFFLAGLLLVCFLALFNLTVAEGTINGVLFFANCVHANQEIFFHEEDKLSRTSFLRVFISWLNLDLGFQVCLYGGMTAYHKFWFECGFLLYLLLIGVLIVCLSRKYIWFTRLIGRNVVAVLSTVILFAYPKLLRLSLKGFYCTKSSYWSTEKSIPLRWHEDETIDCFTGKHIPLFIFSLIMAAVALLYVMSLLFFQCLQRGSSWYVLRWVTKLRPFFDANTGPCRDKYRFWPGLLNLIKFGILLGCTFLISEKEKILILAAVCVLTFFLVLIFPGSVYKKWPLSLLEFWLFLCLGMTSLFILQLHHPSKKENTNIPVGIVAATFALILIYQLYKRVRETRKWKWFVAWLKNKRNVRRLLRDDDVAVNEDAPLLGPQAIISQETDFNKIREPLLECD